MAELKTQVTTQSPEDFIATIEPEEKRQDSLVLLKLFEKATGEKPVMWGSSIIGYGKYHYKSDRSSQEGDWMTVGFAPRKANLTLYIMHGNDGSPLLEKLGKHKSSKGSCLYINKLSDVELNILEKLIEKSFHAPRVNTV